MKKYILPIIVWFISLYLSFASFILIKIVTNDIILNSYKAYSYTKINGNKIINTAENAVDKGKLWWNKLTNKEKSKELEKKQAIEHQKDLEEQEKLKESLEFNQKVLAGLPYVIAIIVFIVTYVKTLEQTEKLVNKFKKMKA